jgi:hypothetical protein
LRERNSNNIVLPCQGQCRTVNSAPCPLSLKRAALQQLRTAASSAAGTQSTQHLKTATAVRSNFLTSNHRIENSTVAQAQVVAARALPVLSSLRAGPSLHVNWCDQISLVVLPEINNLPQGSSACPATAAGIWNAKFSSCMLVHAHHAAHKAACTSHAPRMHLTCTSHAPHMHLTCTSS